METQSMSRPLVRLQLINMAMAMMSIIFVHKYKGANWCIMNLLEQNFD